MNGLSVKDIEVVQRSVILQFGSAYYAFRCGKLSVNGHTIGNFSVKDPLTTFGHATLRLLTIHFV